MPKHHPENSSRPRSHTLPFHGTILAPGIPCVTVGSLVEPGSATKLTRATLAGIKHNMPPVRNAIYSSKATANTTQSAPTRTTTGSSNQTEGFPYLGGPEASPSHASQGANDAYISSSQGGSTAINAFEGGFVSLPFGQIDIAAFEEKMRQAREREEKEAVEHGTAQATSSRDSFKAAMKREGYDCEEEDDGGASGYEGDDEKFGEKNGGRVRKKSDGRAGGGDGDVEMC